ncbi:hypothetical protein [Bosea vestrisii]|uniref:Uncharacterized protein n=1 Tax=Bosea vestrisii TaxID=151416 RepID=A0ABW0H8U2_9HYPH
MKRMLAIAIALIAVPAAASQPVTPTLLPKLIGSSAVVVEQVLGEAKGRCSSRDCGYEVDGKTLSVSYEHGVATEVIWYLRTKEGRITAADLGFGKECDGPKRQPGSGGEVWSRCPGGFSVEIQNNDKGGTFLIHVAARDLLLP